MSFAGRLFKGSAVVAAGELITQLCSLLRNIVLARVLTKSDFGVAAMLGMTISLMELGGRLSIENLVIQSERADDHRFLSAAHLVQVLLGLISGILIFAAAVPISRLFDIPDAAWALRVVALLPILRSLGHLDIYRMRRQLRFAPSALVEVIPQVLITLAVWPLTLVWKSYAVIVWLLLFRQTATTVATHLASRSQYRWQFDMPTLQLILRFGSPMIISGLLLFATAQGDRFVIGIRYTIADLGAYAVAGTLALAPSAALMKLSGTLLLPVLSNARAPIDFQRRLAQSSVVMSLLAALYAIVMIVAGGPLVILIFGPRYSDAGVLTAWLGLAQAIRLLRGLPTVAAMARGETTNLMLSNLWRLSGFAVAIPVAFSGGTLQGIAACAALGELIALIGATRRFTRTHKISLALLLPSWAVALVFIAASGILTWSGLQKLSMPVSLSVACLVLSLMVATYLLLFVEIRTLVFNNLRSFVRGFLRIKVRC